MVFLMAVDTTGRGIGGDVGSTQSGGSSSSGGSGGHQGSGLYTPYAPYTPIAGYTSAAGSTPPPPPITPIGGGGGVSGGVAPKPPGGLFTPIGGVVPETKPQPSTIQATAKLQEIVLEKEQPKTPIPIEGTELEKRAVSHAREKMRLDLMAGGQGYDDELLARLESGAVSPVSRARAAARKVAGGDTSGNTLLELQQFGGITFDTIDDVSDYSKSVVGGVPQTPSATPKILFDVGERGEDYFSPKRSQAKTIDVPFATIARSGGLFAPRGVPQKQTLLSKTAIMVGEESSYLFGVKPISPISHSPRPEIYARTYIAGFDGGLISVDTKEPKHPVMFETTEKIRRPADSIYSQIYRDYEEKYKGSDPRSLTVDMIRGALGIPLAENEHKSVRFFGTVDELLVGTTITALAASQVIPVTVRYAKEPTRARFVEMSKTYYHAQEFPLMLWGIGKVSKLIAGGGASAASAFGALKPVQAISSALPFRGIAHNIGVQPLFKLATSPPAFFGYLTAGEEYFRTGDAEMAFYRGAGTAVTFKAFDVLAKEVTERGTRSTKYYSGEGGALDATQRSIVNLFGRSALESDKAKIAAAYKLAVQQGKTGEFIQSVKEGSAIGAALSKGVPTIKPEARPLGFFYERYTVGKGGWVGKQFEISFKTPFKVETGRMVQVPTGGAKLSEVKGLIGQIDVSYYSRQAAKPYLVNEIGRYFSSKHTSLGSWFDKSVERGIFSVQKALTPKPKADVYAGFRSVFPEAAGRQPAADLDAMFAAARSKSISVRGMATQPPIPTSTPTTLMQRTLEPRSLSITARAVPTLEQMATTITPLRIGEAVSSRTTARTGQRVSQKVELRVEQRTTQRVDLRITPKVALKTHLRVEQKITPITELVITPKVPQKHTPRFPPVILLPTLGFERKGKGSGKRLRGKVLSTLEAEMRMPKGFGGI